MVELNEKAVALAPSLARFGLDAIDLDMLARGDMLGSTGAKVFNALVALSALPAPDDGLVGRLRAEIKPLDDMPPSIQTQPNIRLINAVHEAATALQSKDEQIEKLTREKAYWQKQHDDRTRFLGECAIEKESAEQQVQKLTAAIRSVEAQADNAAWNIGKPGHKFTPADIQAGYFSIRDFARAAIETQEQSNTPSTTVRPEVKSEREILKRLAAGDEIAFSQDGDDAFFTRGDRAFVGRVILSMRSKGYLKRVVLDDENYRGLSERDVISDAGLAALETQEGGK